MRPIYLLFLLFLFLAPAAQAQDLLVRSGDHPTFSRLTIQIPPSGVWSAERTNTGVDLKLKGYEGLFDTSSVFQRMQTSRIKAIRSEGNMLTIDVDCDCLASAFQSGTLVVIDVADAGTPLAGQILALPQEKPRSLDFPARRPPASSGTVLPWIGANSPFATFPPNSSTYGFESATPLIDPAPSERVEVLQSTQTNLVERVANAASIGLLDSNIDAPQRTSPSQKLTSEEATPTPRELPEFVDPPQANIRVTSSMDRPSDRKSAQLNTTTAGFACPEPSYLNVDSWGDESPFSSQISLARTALMDARDQLDLNAAKNLAKVYVYFGFGAEALDVLQLDPALLEQAPHIAAVATILEHGSSRPPHPLRSYTDCASDVALWASLSMKHIPRDRVVDANAALRALNKLPVHLRRIAAPMLSDRFLHYGNAAAASAAMRSIDRLYYPPDADADLANAELAIHAGENAETLLDKVIDANSATTPAALMVLVETKLEQDAPLDAKTVQLIDTYVHEFRGTPTGNDLRQSQIISFALASEFQAAFEALDELAPALSPEKKDDLFQTVVRRLALHADDPDFLNAFFELKPEELARLAPKTKLNLADRLLQTGFVPQAQEVLATTAGTARSETRQILAAKVALRLEQPFQAQAELIGIDSVEANMLRAQAKEMIGSYREASEIFSENGATDRAAATAFLSAEWPELLQSPNTAFAQIAALMTPQPAEIETISGPLQQADAALAESASAREALRQLLQHTNVSQDQNTE